VTLSLVVLLLMAGQSTIDIQLHDTYFVLDEIPLTVLIVGPLTFLIFLVRALSRKFKTKGANIGLIIGLILVAFITFYTIRIQQGYWSEAMRLDEKSFPNREQFMADTAKGINWAWAVFGLWILGLLLLTFKTINIWNQGYSR
jgi:hypothetical protein